MHAAYLNLIDPPEFVMRIVSVTLNYQYPEKDSVDFCVWERSQ